MPASPSAAASGSFTLGDIPITRLGFGAMRITGPGIWGPPKDLAEAKRVRRGSVVVSGATEDRRKTNGTLHEIAPGEIVLEG